MSVPSFVDMSVEPVEDNMEIPPVTPADVVRYRYHHGVNLASCFVLDRNISSKLFAEDTVGASELAAVRDSVSQIGTCLTRLKWEEHWLKFLSDQDIDFLADEARVTTVRLPIGYFTLGPSFCEGTPFASFSPVYVDAWAEVYDLVERLHARGIGTILVMQAAPGGANAHCHSGTDSGHAGLWGSQWFRSLVRECMVCLAREAIEMPGVAGLQIVNEAQPGVVGGLTLYQEVLDALAEVNEHVPVYISDAGDLPRALRFAREQNSVQAGWALDNCPVVVESHVSWTKTADDRAKSPRQIVKDEVPLCLAELHDRSGSVAADGANAIAVGEWNCTLNWGETKEEEREQLTQQFAAMQQRVWRMRTGGHFFHTWKAETADGSNDFGTMFRKKALAAPDWLHMTQEQIDDATELVTARNDWLKREGLRAHMAQFPISHPDEAPEHWRYEQGWDIGFEDVIGFLRHRMANDLNGADRIGYLELWIRKRMLDTNSIDQAGWEFEAGMRQAITAVEEHIFHE